MSRRELCVRLGPTGAAGTRVTVTTRLLFRKDRVETFVCHKAGAVMGAEWVDEHTGFPPDEQLALELSNAAQTAARLAELA